MPSGLNNRRATKGRPASRRLSRVASKKIAPRRAKHLHLPLGFKKRLDISLRSFRTKKEHRSKRYKQFVIRFGLFSIREIAFTTSRHGKVKKRPAKVKQPTVLWLPRRAIAPILLVLLSATSATYFGTHLTKAASLDIKPQLTIAQSPPAKPLPKVMPRSLPVHLRIPSIGVDADLTTMGLTPDGSLQMPTRYDIAAWYTGSPTPGQLGPSIIAGHVDNYKGIGVFFYLRELQTGATISVDRADGTVATFTVTKIAEYSKDAFPTKDVYGNTNYAGIRLITCGGTFSHTTYEYSDNIVVFGALE